MLYGIEAHDIDRVWPAVAHDIEESAKTSRGKFVAEDIYNELKGKTCQLWVWESATARGVFITQIHNYKRNRVCWIRIATGHNYQEWIAEVMQTIEAWAKENGCEAMELLARPGWTKILKDYEMTHIYLEKAL